MSGLHAKLDRKRAVDEHNAVVQNTFAGQMNASFSKIQDSITENSLKQQQMLTYYTDFIGKCNTCISSHPVVISNTTS